jgi:bifunctional DNA-binding transcriptional regulator/antitoxin component of YhaV-PrlF toxin-antitoxin module
METLTPLADMEIATQVFAALGQAVPPDVIRERFGLSQEQFREIIRAQNQKAIDLIHSWQNDDSGYEEENAEAIERALTIPPLSLRGVAQK